MNKLDMIKTIRLMVPCSLVDAKHVAEVFLVEEGLARDCAMPDNRMNRFLRYISLFVRKQFVIRDGEIYPGAPTSLGYSQIKEAIDSATALPTPE